MTQLSQSRRFAYLALFGLFLTTLVVANWAGTADAAKSCFGKRATIVGTPGNDRLVGKKANDVIVGLGGNDVISGGPTGNDRICGGGGKDNINGKSGNDRIQGDAGNDRITGSIGNDRINGGGGRDVVHGSASNDEVAGGGGKDKVFGDNGNDKAQGDGGDDLVDGGLGDDIPRIGNGGVFGGGGTDDVIGGPGVDLVDGGAGDGDVVRGDQGPDEYDGGPGSRDIASFTTASVVSQLGSASPGCQNTEGFAVVVELKRNVACEFLTPRKILDQPLRGIEDVAGSAYNDRLEGDGNNNRIDGGPGDDQLLGGGGADAAFGGSGFDRCSSFQTEESCPGPRGLPSVELSFSIDGSKSLVVQGTDRDDVISISKYPGGYFVETNNALAATNCKLENRTNARCDVKGLTTILGDPAGGNDRFTIGTDVPSNVRSTVIGGGGSDTLIGGDGADHLEAGADGRDTLKGRKGGDALYGGGNDPDRLIAGPGTDLNTVPATCGAGNLINGGPGRDNASYALSNPPGTWIMSLKSNTAGSSRRGCGTDKFKGVQSLEGSKGPDRLIGDGGKNAMLGHDGRDVFIGGGGRDYVDAIDGARDGSINCGGGRDTLLRDKTDPGGSSC